MRAPPTFLTLPAEIRLRIYGYVFADSVVRIENLNKFGFPAMKGDEKLVARYRYQEYRSGTFEGEYFQNWLMSDFMRIISNHRRDIIFVCKQTYAESKDMWLRHTALSAYEDQWCVYMPYRLGLPIAVRRNLRRLHVTNYPLGPIDELCDHLKLVFPALQDFTITRRSHAGWSGFRAYSDAMSSYLLADREAQKAITWTMMSWCRTVYCRPYNVSHRLSAPPADMSPLAIDRVTLEIQGWSHLLPMISTTSPALIRLARKVETISIDCKDFVSVSRVEIIPERGSAALEKFLHDIQATPDVEEVQDDAQVTA